MRLKSLLVIAALGLTGLSTLGQTRSYWGERLRYDREAPTMFFPNELSLDLYGVYTDRNERSSEVRKYGAAFDRPSDEFGGGLGINYYLTRYVGVMADSYLEEWRWPYLANGSLVLRLPIDRVGLAPYVFGGGGRQWKWVPQWTAHVGGGLEIRLNPHTGIFADGRKVFVDHDKGVQDYALVRFGLRFGF